MTTRRRLYINASLYTRMTSRWRKQQLYVGRSRNLANHRTWKVRVWYVACSDTCDLLVWSSCRRTIGANGHTARGQSEASGFSPTIRRQGACYDVTYVVGRRHAPSNWRPASIMDKVDGRVSQPGRYNEDSEEMELRTEWVHYDDDRRQIGTIMPRTVWNVDVIHVDVLGNCRKAWHCKHNEQMSHTQTQIIICQSVMIISSVATGNDNQHKNMTFAHRSSDES